MELIEILDEDFLLRRIPKDNPNYVKPDGTISSYSFKPRGKAVNEISVNIKHLTNYKDSIIDESKFILVQLLAGIPRENGLICVHSPEASNYSHASVAGNFTNSVSRVLARSSVFVGRGDFE